MKIVYRKEVKGNWTRFSHVNLVLTGIFIPNFVLASSAPSSLLAHLLHCINALSKYNPANLLPSFMKQSPILLTLLLHSNWGWNRDKRVKLGSKNRVDFPITLPCIHLFSLKIHRHSNWWAYLMRCCILSLLYAENLTSMSWSWRAGLALMKKGNGQPSTLPFTLKDSLETLPFKRTSNLMKWMEIM